MSKCEKCFKNITKTKPGLECSKCEKTVHLSTACAGLTNKQITALRATENLQWTCQECANSCSRRSIMIPDEESDDEPTVAASNASIDVKKLLKDISKEVEKAIERKLDDITGSLHYQSDKLDEVMTSIESFKQTIKDLQRKNSELINKNQNLETRIGALEQQLRAHEQEKYSTMIEISNLPYETTESIKNIAISVADVLKVEATNIKSGKRQPGRVDRPGNILLELDETSQTNWISAARNKKIFVADILPNCPQDKAKEAVFIREALTPYTKRLLWNAKQLLKDEFMFIWCKKGQVMARKSDTNRTLHRIRTMDDAEKLRSKQTNQ